MLRLGVEVDIVSITPGVIIILVDYDDEVMDKELLHKSDVCHAY